MSKAKSTSRARVKKAGRPKMPDGETAGRRINVRIYKEDETALAHICKSQGVGEGEAVRRALRDLASRIWT
ncbi:MAG TPA: hypothetical protein VK524_34480 [Polyangiaceae bacterium]|nr:hypothetical protein [Polyangiaceae bacterium]